MSSDRKLEYQVAAIGDLSRDELTVRWIKVHGCPPPKGIKRALLERSAARHLQANRLGGLSPMARKTIRASLKPIAQEHATGKAKASSIGIDPSSQLKPGTRLMREWNGRIHVVDVTADGFQFDGKPYRSLLAVARRITGAHWSGPRFFGL